MFYRKVNFWDRTRQKCFFLFCQKYQLFKSLPVLCWENAKPFTQNIIPLYSLIRAEIYTKATHIAAEYPTHRAMQQPLSSFHCHVKCSITYTWNRFNKREWQIPPQRNRLLGDLGDSSAFQATIQIFGVFFSILINKHLPVKNILIKEKCLSLTPALTLDSTAPCYTYLSKKLAVIEYVTSYTHYIRPKLFCQHLPQAYARNGNQRKGNFMGFYIEVWVVPETAF